MIRLTRWTRWCRWVRSVIDELAGEEYERLPSYEELKSRATRPTTGEV